MHPQALTELGLLVTVNERAAKQSWNALPPRQPLKLIVSLALMHDDSLKAVDLHSLVDKLSTEERLRLASYTLRLANQGRTTREYSTTAPPLPRESHGRQAGLHAGAAMMSDDFDAPLPDEFWLGAS